MISFFYRMMFIVSFQAFCLSLNSQTALLKPTGNFAVGRRSILWVDSSRTELWKENGNKTRRVLVYLWYPADSNGRIEAEYFPNANKIKGRYTNQQKQEVSNMRTVARENAPALKAEASFPVLLFSAGGSTPVFFYTTLFEELASHGYVIAAIDHVQEGVGQVFPDGSVERPEVDKLSVKPGPGFIDRAEEFYRQRVNVRAGDIQFVVTKLEELNSGDKDFRNRLDLEHVGAFGHSIGGVAAGQAALLDARIKAAINYDGLSNNKPYFPVEGRQMNHPILFVTKKLTPFNEEHLKRANMNKMQDSLRMKYTVQKTDSVLALSTVASYKITLKDVGHESFSDVILFDHSIANEGAAALQLIRKYTLLFFDRYLKTKQHIATDEFVPGVYNWGSVEQIR